MMIVVAGCETRREDVAPSNAVVSEVSADSSPTWHVRLPGRVVIGAGDGAKGPYQLHRVVGAHLLSDGRIAIMNGGSHEIRYFDADGRFLHAVGRQGGGPGEFDLPVNSWTLPGDSVVVVDNTADRISVFAPSGAFVRSFSLESTPEISRPNAIGRFADGTVAGLASNVPSLREEMIGKVVAGEETLARYSATGTLLGPLATSPTRARYVVSVRGPLRWPFTPFTVGTTYAFYDSTFFMATGRDFTIDHYRATGEPMRRVQVDAAPRPVTAADREGFAAGLLANVRSDEERVLQNRYLAAAPFPETIPQVGALIASSDGQLWVSSYTPMASGDRLWHVIDTAGRWSGTALIPRGLSIREIHGDRILAVARDSLGVESVLLLELDQVDRFRAAYDSATRRGVRVAATGVRIHPMEVTAGGRLDLRRSGPSCRAAIARNGHVYSTRSALLGSARVARSAGPTAATIAMASMIAPIAA